MRKERLVEIRSDVFDIADRMKEIDEGYSLYYNLDRKRYEVWKGGELAVTWQEGLHAGLLSKLRETAIRRRAELLKEIERSEEKARRDEAHRMKERIGERTEDFMRSEWHSR